VAGQDPDKLPEVWVHFNSYLEDAFRYRWLGTICLPTITHQVDTSGLPRVCRPTAVRVPNAEIQHHAAISLGATHVRCLSSVEGLSMDVASDQGDDRWTGPFQRMYIPDYAYDDRGRFAFETMAQALKAVDTAYFASGITKEVSQAEHECVADHSGSTWVRFSPYRDGTGHRDVHAMTLR
jgi:hypothetical protein